MRASVAALATILALNILFALFLLLFSPVFLMVLASFVTCAGAGSALLGATTAVMQAWLRRRPETVFPRPGATATRLQVRRLRGAMVVVLVAGGLIRLCVAIPGFGLAYYLILMAGGVYLARQVRYPGHGAILLAIVPGVVLSTLPVLLALLEICLYPSIDFSLDSIESALIWCFTMSALLPFDAWVAFAAWAAAVALGSRKSISERGLPGSTDASPVP